MGVSSESRAHCVCESVSAESSEISDKSTRAQRVLTDESPLGEVTLCDERTRSLVGCRHVMLHTVGC